MEEEKIKINKASNISTKNASSNSLNNNKVPVKKEANYNTIIYDTTNIQQAPIIPCSSLPSNDSEKAKVSQVNTCSQQSNVTSDIIISDQIPVLESIKNDKGQFNYSIHILTVIGVILLISLVILKK